MDVGAWRFEPLYAYRLFYHSAPTRCRWPLLFRTAPAYAGAILKQELKEAGITYRGTLLRQTQVNEPGTIVASKQSAPLHDLLKIMLKKSDNMIADTVFRMIGSCQV
ncbi:penicillin-binding protein [Salmonella enterica subsp. enterica]|uniref:Penicillin-binding protein n=1 Tax=Salmonella enterica I TaxID=59201 RepID=A0A447TUN7_SALET|nr:penicillin-binding protein [Salmonella enterica subsp. enterica]